VRAARHLPYVLLAAGVALLAAMPSPASACAVCLGDPDSPMADGVNNGILFLLAVIGLVQVGFVALFVSLRNRSRRLEHRREQFRIIEGGVK
jgi:type IV secretory pathway VirB2 component (pilin)